jgi:hypothetical protein
MKRFIPLLISGLLIVPGGAFAFGVDPGNNNLGSEHEKITRAAVRDLEPLTLRELAGDGDHAGAVGIPDDPDRGLVNQASAHCDAGDFLETDGEYAQSREQAQKALSSCRDFMISNIEHAVALAGGLYKGAPEAMGLNCNFTADTHSVKCKVLAHLGLAFHAAQDFYAHSNWVDRPAAGRVTGKNPPGLGQSGRARWLDPRLKEEFPQGLISGCPGDLRLLGVTVGCGYGDLPPVLGKMRILREDLGKTRGPIGRGAGGTGTTPRGAMNGNFSRAVSAAVEDTADKWAFFRERVLETYGRTRGATILCILEKDSADAAGCKSKAEAATVCFKRELNMARLPDDDSYGTSATPSEAERAGARPQFESLRRFCVIEETDVTRAHVINGSTSVDGRSAAETEAIDSLAYWGACPAELQRNLPSLTQSTKESYKSLLAQAKPDPRQEQSLLSRLYASCILDAHLRQLRK